MEDIELKNSKELLHTIFTSFISSSDINSHTGTSDIHGREVYEFSDREYGSFIIEYLPYTLGGYKKDLFVFRYFEFDTIYFYYDVLNRVYVVEKNNRVVKSGFREIEKDLNYILCKICDIVDVVFDNHECDVIIQDIEEFKLKYMVTY